MLPGGWEWLILVLIALLLFGGSRLPGVGKNAGKAIREFKEETAPPAPPAPAAEPERPISPAKAGSSPSEPISPGRDPERL